MTITKEELIKIRIQLAKDMHQYIINLGDENIWLKWIAIGVPDEPYEEDYLYIAESDKEWIDLCTLFGELIKNNYWENLLTKS